MKRLIFLLAGLIALVFGVLVLLDVVNLATDRTERWAVIFSAATVMFAIGALSTVSTPAAKPLAIDSKHFPTEGILVPSAPGSLKTHLTEKVPVSAAVGGSFVSSPPADDDLAPDVYDVDDFAADQPAYESADHLDSDAASFENPTAISDEAVSDAESDDADSEVDESAEVSSGWTHIYPEVVSNALLADKPVRTEPDNSEPDNSEPDNSEPDNSEPAQPEVLDPSQANGSTNDKEKPTVAAALDAPVAAVHQPAQVPEAPVSQPHAPAAPSVETPEPSGDPEPADPEPAEPPQEEPPLKVSVPHNVDLENYTDSELVSTVKRSEESVIRSMVDRGHLSGTGPLTDHDVATMLFLSWTSQDLIDELRTRKATSQPIETDEQGRVDRAHRS